MTIIDSAVFDAAPAEPDEDRARERLIPFGSGPLSIEDIVAISRLNAPVALSADPAFRQRVDAGVCFLETLLGEEGGVYGVTTGFGDSCEIGVPLTLVEQLPLHLSRFHGCGLGRHFEPQLARGVLAARLASLSRGSSGVRWVLLQRIVEFLNADVVPFIPEEGSVGASGDLTPLSYVAALLVGERDALYQGVSQPAAAIHAALDLEPLVLRPKEGLAIMNGTAVMTALACEAFVRADYLTRLCARLTAMASAAIGGNDYHYDEQLFAVKPHPGQAEIAGWIREDLGASSAPNHSNRLQDRYSLRCAPHIIGVLRDSLPWLRSFIETELNSANDNPIIDGEHGRVLHGGHFYGGHIAFAMDAMKVAVANLADLMDRQAALLVDTKFSNGLPPNLSGSTGPRAAINHGFKAVQIGMSAWTAEALKLTMPASVFSRSTECHNQDKVSMGTIAARDALRILELTEQVAASLSLIVTQALEMRERVSGNGSWRTGPMNGTVEAVRSFSAQVDEDRPLEAELREAVRQIQTRAWSF